MKYYVASYRGNELWLLKLEKNNWYVLQQQYEPVKQKIWIPYGSTRPHFFETIREITKKEAMMRMI